MLRTVPTTSVRCAMLLLALTALTCDGSSIYGMPAEQFLAKVRAGDLSVLQRVRLSDAEQASRLGQGALYYVARLAEKRGFPDLELRLLDLALARETGIAQRRAADLLAERLHQAGNWDRLLEVQRACTAAHISSYRVASRAVDALIARARWNEALTALDLLRTTFPAEIARDGGSSLVQQALCERGAGSAAWVQSLAAIVAATNATADVLLKAYGMAIVPLVGTDASVLPDESTTEALALRVAVATRDYGKAATLALKVVTTATASTPRAIFSDAGKAFLYAEQYAQGESVMANVEASDAFASQAETRFVAAFYRGRYARAMGRRDAAVAQYRLAASIAGPADRDSALWYLIKERYAASPTAGIAALGEYATSWVSASTFSDLMDIALCDVVRRRDWTAVRALYDAVAHRASSAMKARLSYVLGRAIELGKIRSPNNTTTTDLFSIAANGTDPYYRMMGAFRLGRLPFSMPAQAQSLDSNGLPEREAEEPALTYLLDFAKFGIPELIWDELGPLLPNLSDDALRTLADTVRATESYPEALTDSMRIIGKLRGRSTYVPRPADYAAWWPRPYEKETAIALGRYSVPDYLLYGLMRSESFFRPAVASSAGAIGLTQLMPATAAATAKAIGLIDYDITEPSDNILIGTAHFSALLKETGRRYLHAIFAYNAGSGRLARWKREAPGLPDDLFLESLSIEETRQYGRNVLTASVAYAALGGADATATLRTLLAE